MATTRDRDWWPRLDEAFHGALELPGGERSAYLDRVCDANDELRAEVDEMLAADAPPHAFGMERLIHDDDGSVADVDPFIGMQLGLWRVVNLVAHGGMGTVYLAERVDGQYEQRVALKIIRDPPGNPVRPLASKRRRTSSPAFRTRTSPGCSTPG